MDQNLRTPYVQNYNLNLQQALGSRASFQIGYVGSSGRKLFRYRDLNQLDPTSPGFVFQSSFPFPNIGYFNQFEATTSSTYHSLQTSLQIRNWQGLTSRVNYTWSHALGLPLLSFW